MTRPNLAAPVHGTRSGAGRSTIGHRVRRCRPATRAHAPDTQRGIALVLVLWLLVLLTVIAVSHARNVRLETRLAYNQMEHTEARALAEAGVNRAIMELLVRGDMPRYPVDGTVNRIAIDHHVVSFSMRNASGLVDLNTAQPALLDALMTAAGVDEAKRADLVDAILDWRDSDDLRHLHGAEDSEYRHAGLAWGVRNGPFSSVDELRYVLGMTGALYRRLLPYLTVYSGYGGIRLEYAPPALVALLSGAEDGGAAPPPAPPAGAATTGADGVYHIIAWAGDNTGTRATLEAVVRITAMESTPYVILSWREPVRFASLLPG
jgi:general secretion pathway protein K